MKTTSLPPLRRSASTGPATASTGHSTWALTRTRSPSRRRSAHWRYSPPTTSGCCWMPAAGIRRLRRCPGRSWRITDPGTGPAPTGSSSRHRTTRPRTAVSSTTRRMAGRPDGGPAGTDITRQVQDRANALLADGLTGVRRIPYARAVAADTTGRFDFTGAYVSALGQVVDLAAIKTAGIRIGADPLGGASVGYWGEIGDRYGLDLTVVNPGVDATFRFMTLDWDGKIRMDCSSPSAMASLIARPHEVRIETSNDTDSDRHGIVTPDAGLLNPNHYLAVAIDYLYSRRDGWPATAAVGKTLVSSSMIDRVAGGLGRRLLEVPVGFKWFVPGLLDGSGGFGGEESAGASDRERGG